MTIFDFIIATCLLQQLKETFKGAYFRSEPLEITGGGTKIPPEKNPARETCWKKNPASGTTEKNTFTQRK